MHGQESAGLKQGSTGKWGSKEASRDEWKSMLYNGSAEDHPKHGTKKTLLHGEAFDTGLNVGWKRLILLTSVIAVCTLKTQGAQQRKPPQSCLKHCQSKMSVVESHSITSSRSCSSCTA